MLERRTNLSQDFDGIRLRGKYAHKMASISFVPTKSLRLDDNDEGILDDQISFIHEDVFEGPPHQSSTPPSIKSSFEEFEDPLPKSLSLPLYNEPMHDVYEDGMFDGVLSVDTPVNINDKPIQVVIVEKNNGGVDRSVKCIGNVDAMISAFDCVHDGWGVAVLEGVPSKDVKFLTKPINFLNEKTLKETQMILDAFTITSIPYACATLERLKISRQIDTGWTYPDWFRQSNMSTYCGQPHIFLRA